MRRTHPSPLLALAVLALAWWSSPTTAQEQGPAPRVVAENQPAKSEPIAAPKELPPAPVAKDVVNVAAKEEAKAEAKEEPKADPVAEVKKGVEENKKAIDAANANITSAQRSGDSAWMLMSSALVMLMLPGLALFYGGMVRRKNVLSTMMHSMAILALVGLYWVVIGYSLAFGPSLIKVGGGGIVGWSWDLVLLQNVKVDDWLPNSNITVLNHVMFQGMFAIITPALISGALAERIRFWPFCLFILLWVTFVYCPLAHMVWAYDWFYDFPTVAGKKLGESAVGYLGMMGALDFAGGTVVHIAAGVAGLAGALALRKRLGYPEHAMHPNSVALTLLGAGLLWFGWFGFNGGSAVASNSLAASAFAATQAATAAAGLSWIVTEWLVKGKPTALGLASGIVAGLVAITPAAGFVFVWGGVLIGLLAGVVCYFAVSLKSLLGYDDSLDAFGVHAVGGFLGAVLTGVFCSTFVNSLGADGLFAARSQPAAVAALEAKYPEAKLDLDDRSVAALKDAIPDLEKKDPAAAAVATQAVAPFVALASEVEAAGKKVDALKGAPTPDKKAIADAETEQKAFQNKLDILTARHDGDMTEYKKLRDAIGSRQEAGKGALSQLVIQFKAAIVAAILSFVLSFGLVLLVQAITLGNFTTDPKSETEGLDRTEHGEVGFDYGPGLDTTPAPSAEPRAATVPPGGKRFEVVIEGTENGSLMHAWSDMCQPANGEADPDFKAVYPYVTTVQGNRFRFRGGDPTDLSGKLQRVLQKRLGGKPLKVRVEG